MLLVCTNVCLVSYKIKKVLKSLSSPIELLLHCQWKVDMAIGKPSRPSPLYAESKKMKSQSTYTWQPEN